LLKAKQDEVKAVQNTLTGLWEKMNVFKSGLEEYYDKSNKLRNRMTIILPADKM